MLELESAIKCAEELAEKQEKEAKEWHENQVRKCELIPFAEMDYTHENKCKECAEALRQFAEWLKELKRLREQESVLDKVRVEIEKTAFKDVCGEKFIFVNRINQIINKYKLESE